MPTGYTAKVESGEVTELRDYMLICAIGWIVSKMLRYREPIVAPYEREHRDV